MDWITTLEDSVLEKIKAVVGDHVRTFDTVGGTWSMDMLRRALHAAPGIFVAFIGGRPAGLNFNAVLDVYIVTSNGRGEEARRRGDQEVVGAYQLIALMMSALNTFSVDDVGTLKLTQVRNLFQEALFELGGTVYALSFEVLTDPQQEVDDSLLDDFLRYDANWNLDAAQDGEPLATDNVEIPQEEQ